VLTDSSCATEMKKASFIFLKNDIEKMEENLMFDVHWTVHRCDN